MTPFRRQLWGAHIRDDSTPDGEKAPESGLSPGIDEKALIMSPDRLNADPASLTVMAILRTTHEKRVPKGEWVTKPWEIDDRPRSGPCNLPAVIDCMTIYRPRRVPSDLLYDGVAGRWISTLRDYLDNALSDEEMAAADARFADTILGQLSSGLRQRLRLGFRGPEPGTTRGSVLKITTSYGTHAWLMLTNDLFRWTRKPSIVAAVSGDVQVDGDEVRLEPFHKTLRSLDLDVVDAEPFTHLGRPVVFASDDVDTVARSLLEYLQS